MKEGKVVEHGSPNELLAQTDGGEFAHLLKLYTNRQDKGGHSGDTKDISDSGEELQMIFFFSCLFFFCIFIDF